MCALVGQCRPSGRRCRPGVICLDRVKQNNAEGLQPTSAFILYWFWLRSTGCFGWDKWHHWLCKSRQCPVSGCRAPLRWFSGPGCLSRVSGSKEHLGFLRYIWNLGWHYGNEMLPLWKIYACRLNCRCQFADGRQTWN